MARMLRTVAAVVAAAWLTWNLYRHVLVYGFRGRVVVLTERVMGVLLLAAGILVALAAPSPPTVAIALVAGAATVSIRGAELWLVVGASPKRIFERAGIVLRGMSLPFEAAGGRCVTGLQGRIRLSVVATPRPRTSLLRVRTTKGVAKVALFRANLRKFLLAIPRERR